MTYIPDKEAFGVYKMLAQINPAAANVAEQLYSPNANEEVHIKAWTVVNTNANDVDFLIYVDDDGVIWDDTTLVFSGVVDKLEATPAGDLGIFMNNSAGSIGFEADDVDCTITIWGIVYDLS